MTNGEDAIMDCMLEELERMNRFMGNGEEKNASKLRREEQRRFRVWKAYVDEA